ncbi:alpha/beta hydrolase [Amylibacter sp. SFDW26]|uniref:alpha/beta hydrolase n=1 Tax=Amylibacter sp. SFDW26 TaxID=2652722 RepID=UPI001261FCEB|nr:alpha/beta hydrolase [Amylibacter sp. SFDW26]KAB7615564.1 alpha/beta hydrolase [Amylibacter sp. SFDW26]
MMFSTFLQATSSVSCLKSTIGFAISMLAVSCAPAPNLTQTPTVYLQQDYPANMIPKDLQTTQPKLYFMTDRFLSDEWTDQEPYSSNRSPSMAFGEVTVSFGKDKSWGNLVQSSESKERAKDISLKITDADELIRFPSTPLLFDLSNTSADAKNDPAFRTYKKREMEFKNALSNLLKQSNKRDVVLFVHGFNNEFDDAAYAMADLWHFSGRIGVPLFFTWPSGAGGLFGYFKDRESGEYSVFHLKETLRLISQTSGLDNVHIIAHSRGADVVTTALRELLIEARGAGKSPYETYKIENLILAAPDLDFGIVRQRLIAERFATAFGQVNIYVNKNDGALGIAQKLATGQRLGRLRSSNLEHIDKAILERAGNVHFIDVENSGSSVGHSYFRQNPNVLSDIALTLQSSAKPGAKERPLLPLAGNFWRLTEFYPFDIRPEGFGQPEVAERVGN